MKINKTNI